ncbi:hypothetical protein CKAH01_03769 [Colletotrichum kahawae]|uniref:Uncharacterized protein n=1 Tax=Colletotrichum kahawae TaxID=34407 RepID=A0AAE0DBD1_COLKA|nr:hypothetical protein CKAH01_03769 [Colletotrichum kahawae]
MKAATLLTSTTTVLVICTIPARGGHSAPAVGFGSSPPPVPGPSLPEHTPIPNSGTEHHKTPIILAPEQPAKHLPYVSACRTSLDFAFGLTQLVQPGNPALGPDETCALFSHGKQKMRTVQAHNSVELGCVRLPAQGIRTRSLHDKKSSWEAGSPDTVARRGTNNLHVAAHGVDRNAVLRCGRRLQLEKTPPGLARDTDSAGLDGAL